MIPRDAEQTIRTPLKGFPVITLTGLRQSGKTTLAKSIFSDG
jgi:predicted AAA+ superfamily ATPase